ncbi:MAG: DUF222 domain-containing protein [Actinomycetota bacterium]
MGSGVSAEPDIRVRDRRLDEVCGHLNALTGELVDLAVDVLADGSVLTGNGIYTHRQYLAWRCGISTRRAAQVVTIAERIDTFPRCVQLMRDGLISLDQMAVIAEHAPDWADPELCDLAAHMTVTQLRRTMDHFPSEPHDVSDERADDTDGGQSARDRFSMRTRSDGRFTLNVETDGIAGIIISQAVEEAKDALFQNDPETSTWVSALVEIANRSLDAVDDQSRRDRYRLHLHVNTDAPADIRNPHGWRVPDDVARYLTCDCAIVPTMLADGVPFSVGRTSRVTPERTRRIVIHRDQGCRVPGCNHTHHLEIHHIIHWTDDGPTETWNLIALCAHHHRLHHRGELHISGNADLPAGTPGAVTLTASNGTVLTGSGARPEPPGAAPPQPAKPYHGPAGERLNLRWLEFRDPSQFRTRGYDTDEPHRHN